MDDPPFEELPAEVEDRLIAALELAPAERDAAVEALCSAHSALAGAIRAAVRGASERSAADADLSLAEAFRRAAGESASIGARVGGFRIVERLGAGTYGEVFRAEQREPLRRSVALKVLRERAGRDDVLARFEAERQVLASLDHPGIAKVLDAGATEDGRPWFAMELVPAGRTITRFCAEERLTLRDRLVLFARVCDAVQHAHGRGILHRDLKPGNVLCARVDGEPAPKIIDFGLAKATRGALTELPWETLAGSPVGTPLYASPEQVRGAADVDVRTDVYALGALLHELCCGEPPFAEHDLGRVWSEDRARFFEVVTARDPAPPSQRLVASAAETPWGEDRRELAAAVRGDLDAIVARALARARQDRYVTVSELGADVLRAAAGEPVLARMPGVVARAVRTARRHRQATIAGFTAAALLLASLLYALRKNAQLEVLRAQEAAAVAQLEHAVGELAAERTALARTTARLEREGREGEEVRRLMRHAASSLAGTGTATLDEWADRLVRPVASGAEVWTPGVEATLRRTAAWVFAGLGRNEDAREQLEGALALLTAEDRDTRLKRAATAHALADESGRLLGSARTRELLREARDIFEDELGHDAPETMMAAGDLAFQLVQSKSFTDRAKGLLMGLDISRRILFPDGADLTAEEADARLTAWKDEVWAQAQRGDLDGALETLDRILAPVLEQPVLRARLCNSLWAASRYEPLRPVAPVLLEAAVAYGEREHGPGHDHVMVARGALLARSLEEGAGDELTRLARGAAHALRQARLEEVVTWSKEQVPITGEAALERILARARDAGLLPSRAGEFLAAVREAGILDDAGLAELRARVEP